MSRSKKLYILLGVFVVACIATLAVTQIAEHKEQIMKSLEEEGYKPRLVNVPG